jgi:hypothetical protein
MCCCVNQISNSVVSALDEGVRQRQRNVISIKNHVRQVAAVSTDEHARREEHGSSRWPSVEGIVSNSKPGLNSWSMDNLVSRDTGAAGLGGDNVHFHLSFQSRVGPVQWIK